MDKQAEFFGQCRAAQVVECSRLADLPTRELPRNAREESPPGGHQHPDDGAVIECGSEVP